MINHTTNADIDELLRANYFASTSHLRYHHIESWRTNKPLVELPATFELIQLVAQKATYEVLGEFNRCTVRMKGEKYPTFWVSSNEEGRATQTLKILLEHYPLAKPIDESTVEVSFWYGTQNGARVRVREIQVPSWEEIKDNYTESTAEKLSEMFEPEFIRNRGLGKIILFTGEPGTGKTYAVRALMRGIKDVSFNYILDPERFFGEDANYMMEVILRGQEEAPLMFNIYDDEGDLNPSKKSNAQFLILEDVGELISADAKLRAGQGFSRLLNVSEGLIGQGLNLTILLTSNDHIKDFHPAIFRNGRCAASIEFQQFLPEDAEKWLQQRGIDLAIKEPIPLSDLFALKDGNNAKKKKSRQKLGF